MQHIWRLEFQDFRTRDSVVLCASHEVPMKSECGLDSRVSCLHRIAFGGVRGRGMPNLSGSGFGFMRTLGRSPVRADLSSCRREVRLRVWARCCLAGQSDPWV